MELHYSCLGLQYEGVSLPVHTLSLGDHLTETGDEGGVGRGGTKRNIYYTQPYNILPFKTHNICLLCRQALVC